ncbi:PAS domain-containing sensor histidine kinase [Fundidesulfovibrio agrisoli]|uniref:PAS domain-containing sensor histidine kinase n=1 Tax=Fundidesulfovibrio agrisoli TaxID=2922717 RepID=UPI001FAD87AB|nr:PAS domain S-box protein [Fundidesulfovibrio agrisoli]
MFNPTPVRVAVTYAVLSALWIFTSDKLMGALFANAPRLLILASTLKGWIFVVVTAILLYMALVRVKRQAESQGSAVRMAEERLSHLVETAPIGIFRSTPEGRFLFANPALARIHGYADAAAFLHAVTKIGEDLYADPQRRIQLLERLREHGSVYNFESLRKRSDGGTVWVSTSASMVADPLTGEQSIHGFTVDISTRKHAELLLREQEEYSRRLIEASPLPIAVTDLSTGSLSINPAFTRLLGYMPQDVPMIDSWWTQAYPDPDMRERVRRDWDNRFSSPEPSGETLPPTEREVTDKTGKVHTIGFHVARIGRLVVAMLVDLSERIRSEEALRGSEERFRSIVESSPSAMHLYTLEQSGELRFTLANPTADRLLGITHEELYGKTLLQAFPALQKTHIPETYLRVALGELPPQSFETTYKDGVISGTFEVHAFRTGENMLVVSFTEISERVRLRELMVQTEKMLSVGGLAAGVAHEINNPLAGILQSVQNILRRIEPELPANARAAQEAGLDLAAMRRYLENREILGFLEAIRHSGERAARIVQNMLSFTRKSSSRHVPTDMAELLENTLEIAATHYDLKKKYDFRRIEIVRDYQPGMPKVPCSPQEIQQVVFNLLDNAAQAGVDRPVKDEPLRITLRLRAGSDYAALEVEDNGPGMEEDVRKKVFEPFFTTKDVGEGTGLGLSVSYFIVTGNHHGTFQVRSTPGEGTTFIIRLPLGGE